MSDKVRNEWQNAEMSDKNNMVICYEIILFVVFLMVILRH